jgi:hypothetical protein
MSGLSKLGLMVVMSYVVIYAFSYTVAEIICRVTEDN